MAQRPPEFFRAGPIAYTRREFFTRAGIIALLVAAGVAGAVACRLADQFILGINQNGQSQETIPESEIVRGTLLNAYDDSGNLIQGNRVSGNHLIMMVSELAAPGVSLTKVQETGAFEDLNKPWPVVREFAGPNFTYNYLGVADLNNLGGLVPHGSPFEISWNVDYVNAHGVPGRKLGEPGPIHYTRT